MSNFKAGDRVRCIRAGNTLLELGKIYTVTEDQEGNNIFLDEAQLGWYPDRFELTHVDPFVRSAETLTVKLTQAGPNVNITASALIGKRYVYESAVCDDRTVEELEDIWNLVRAEALMRLHFKVNR